jgi:hypothetical protein
LVQSAAAGGFGLFEECFHIGHNFRPSSGQVLRFAGIGVEIVERGGRVVPEGERSEFVLIVSIAAGTWVVEIFSWAAPDG